MVLTLPYPPSVNTIWRRVGSKTILSAKGREYRAAVAAAVSEQAPALVGCVPYADRLSVLIIVHAPDRRARDLDNVPKAILDGLTRAGVWCDDSQIDDLHITRGNMFAGGAVRVTVEVMP